MGKLLKPKRHLLTIRAQMLRRNRFAKVQRRPQPHRKNRSNRSRRIFRSTWLRPRLQNRFKTFWKKFRTMRKRVPKQLRRRKRKISFVAAVKALFFYSALLTYAFDLF